jgi:AcrR family transcriptional regulator
MEAAPQRDRGNSARPYHHGHLREALVDAALATARAEGPGAVVLRAATRAAGVSPNAAYRHFADRGDLLEAVAERCQQQMASLMRARLDEAGARPGPDGAWERLRIVGHAYVEFALIEPGWFATAFAIPLTTEPGDPEPAGCADVDLAGAGDAGPAGSGDTGPAGDAGLGEARDGDELFAILVSTLDELVSAGAIPPEARPGAEYVAWSAVHGIATLLTDGSLRNLSAAERDAAIDRVINAVSF